MLQTQRHLATVLRKKKRIGFFHHTLVLYKDRILIFGGNDKSFNYYNDIYEYDFRKNKIIKLQTTGNKPIRNTHYTAVIYKDSMFLFTAAVRNYSITEDYYGNMYRFDCINHHWYDVEIMDRGMIERHQHSAVVYNDVMIIFGGFTDYFPSKNPFISKRSSTCGLVSNLMMEFSFLNYRWKNMKMLGDIPNPRCGHSAVLHGDIMYIFGGYLKCLEYPGITYFNDLYAFNCKTNYWTRLKCYGHIPSGRRVHSACIYNNLMFVLGGETETEYSGEMFVFNIKSQTWKRIETNVYPPTLSCHSTIAIGTCLYTFGGHVGEKSNEMHIFCFGYLLGYFTMENIMKANQFANVVFEFYDLPPPTRKRKLETFENLNFKRYKADFH